MLQTGAKDEPATRDEFLEVIAARVGPAHAADARAARARARGRPRRAAEPRRRAGRAAARAGGRLAPAPRRRRRRRRLPAAARDRRRRRPARAGARRASPRTPSSTPSAAASRCAAGARTARRDRGRRHRQRHPGPDRARIFDRFYRAGDRDGGFGLGLSIAREAVRTLGGEIELESEQSVGTTVRITYRPAAPASLGAVEPAGTSEGDLN